MALAGALCVALNTVVGFTNKSLRALVSQLLEGPFSSAQMTYDLRRLRLKGLVARVEHTNTYTLTEHGIRFAVTYTKLGRRVLPPLLAADYPPAPTELRYAFRVMTATWRITWTRPVSEPQLENLPQISRRPEQRFSRSPPARIASSSSFRSVTWPPGGASRRT
jgi:hypothetical protein